MINKAHEIPQLCSLCLESKNLCNSHLMPKGLYRLLRKPFDGGKLILGIAHTKTVKYTDDQICVDLLCKSCEELFSKKGENIVLPYCYSGKSFPLLEWLNSSTPFQNNKNERWFNPERSNFKDVDAFLYFAVSMFWRSSVWPKPEASNQGSLGTMYQEQFRKYLLGERSFPENAYIAVYVDSGSDINPIMSFPYSSKKKGYHLHSFTLPGIKFNMNLGGKIGGIREVSKATNTQLFFVSYNASQHPDAETVRKALTQGLVPKGKLAKIFFSNH